MRTQLKFATSIIPHSTNTYDRIEEVCKLKRSLAKMFSDENYRFAIVGETVTSNTIHSLSTIDFIISAVSQATNMIDQIHEDIALRKKIAEACGINDHHCVVAGEDMMSDHALQKVYGLPIGNEGEGDE